MTCKNCLYYKRCKKLGIFNVETLSECEDFTDRSKWVHLPRKPIPLMKSKYPYDSDVYCPRCGETMSGYYGENPLGVVQCFHCGEIIDTTKAVTKEEAEKTLEGMK